MAPARVFVDTVAPKASFTLSGRRAVGAPVKVTVRSSDRGSGVAKVTVFWGDGTPHTQVSHTKAHIYKRAGRFKVKVVIADRAGNTKTLTRQVTITRNGATQPAKKG